MDWENRRRNKTGFLQEVINSEDKNVDQTSAKPGTGHGATLVYGVKKLPFYLMIHNTRAYI